MPEIEYYQDADKAGKKGVPLWSFKVDGQPSGYWCPTEHAVRRVVGRLELGRSREAFGGMAVVISEGPAGRKVAHVNNQGGRGIVHEDKDTKGAPEKVTMKSGTVKERPAKSKFRYTLDGVVSDKTFDTEQAARTACAFHAFMTRGKLAIHGKEVDGVDGEGNAIKVTVEYDGKGLTGVDDDGNRYAVGFDRDGNHKVKPLVADNEG